MPMAAAVEGHRRLVMLHVGGSRRFRERGGPASSAPPTSARNRRQIDGFRDVEEVEGHDLAGANLGHPGIVSCRHPVTVVNFSRPLSSCHKAPVAFCGEGHSRIPEVFQCHPRGFRLCALAVLFLLGFGSTPRIGTIRSSRRRRHGPRLVGRGRARGEGHADQHRDRRVADARPRPARGNYEFVAVPVGVYLVTAEKNGFSIALVDNVQVQVGARLRVDLQMAVGQVTEKVEVTAASPLLETDTSQRGQVITGDADARAAAERPRVLVAGAADDRRPRSRR